MNNHEPASFMDVSDGVILVRNTARRITQELGRYVIGKDDLVEALLLCLLAEGHILLVGNPGIAKTTTAKLFAQTLGCVFNRQQFTPDVLASDVIGSYVYDQMTHDFHVRKGGIFSNIVMVDEINRASPRTQAALLESMEERNVTIEGTTFKLDRPFMVIATQSAIPYEGTYPLPTVQLDRFAMMVPVEYPTRDDERKLLTAWGHVAFQATQVTDRDTLLRMIEIVRNIHVDEKVIWYITDLIARTRDNPNLRLPASPRGSLALLACSRALAAVRGRDYVIPEDVKRVARPVLNHRIVVAREPEFSGVTNVGVITDLLDEVPINLADQ